MKLLLLSMPNCSACIRLKNNLDKLQYSLIDAKFTYEIIDISDRQDLVDEYDVQGVPCLIFPSGKILRYSLGVVPLQELIEKEYQQFLDKKEEL